jgi:hypothetical protein
MVCRVSECPFTNPWRAAHPVRLVGRTASQEMSISDLSPAASR